ncbi:pantoate--beta-alanine ligase [Rarobacter faecitabidus]|uniref:Pantothenate synthetase n=1 Tax=Rarobacter faecitabidus TaxID=13243 RepID=A0A542ZTK1_RARFA|nr:pantoate--beta-alanine ligase [Rarobacter faecitabidus]TQL63684.1 pantothenate synthetase [Rarobacter faecitabidus]
MTSGGSGHPRVLRTHDELASLREGLAGTVAVVMTMGALHAGHLSLVRAAAAHADSVIVTIFVNPLQFGEGEDYDLYPRTLDADVAALAGLGVAGVFAPSAREMYPSGVPEVSVRAGRLGSVLEGEMRPGHFDGMLTVVLKLLNLTRPDVAVFGRKDAQQLALIRAMIRDLNLPVAVVGAPIVREADGLALSSRNRYLSGVERAAGLGLSRALRAAAEAAAAGRPASDVIAAARDVLEGGPVAPNVTDVNYVEGVEPETMEGVDDDYEGPLLVLIAARVGQTRLLDNAEVLIRQTRSERP